LEGGLCISAFPFLIHGVLDQMLKKKAWSLGLIAESMRNEEADDTSWKTNISDRFNYII
jgi:hypothetical protein